MMFVTSSFWQRMSEVNTWMMIRDHVEASQNEDVQTMHHHSESSSFQNWPRLVVSFCQESMI